MYYTKGKTGTIYTFLINTVKTNNVQENRSKKFANKCDLSAS